MCTAENPTTTLEGKVFLQRDARDRKTGEVCKVLDLNKFCETHVISPCYRVQCTDGKLICMTDVEIMDACH